jgi:hypothetical protein
VPCIKMVGKDEKQIQVDVGGHRWLIEGADEGWVVTRLRPIGTFSAGEAEAEGEWVLPYQAEPAEARGLLYDLMGRRYGQAAYRRLTDLLVR